MTIKRVNSTGRKKIFREDAKVRIESTESGHKFSVQLKLDDYDLPANARVYIEAYKQSTLMRFPFGVVSDPGTDSDLVLSDFHSPEGVLFRIKVIDSSNDRGMLLAEGNIPASDSAETPEDRLALLPPQSAPLGDELWRVDVSDSPVLLVNEKLADWKATVQTAHFRSLVFPAAIRYVLLRIFLSDDEPDTDDADAWPSHWITFAESLSGVGPCPKKDDNELEWMDWIDSVCERFSAQNRLLDSFGDFGEES